jgi:hypothetical protein
VCKVIKKLFFVKIFFNKKEAAMKNFLLSLLFISLTIISYAQNTTVVKLQDGWKFTTGDNSQYASPDFDDAQWRDIK